MVSSRARFDIAVPAPAAPAGSIIPVRIRAEEEAKKQIIGAESTTTTTSTTTVLQAVVPDPVVPLIENLTLEQAGGIDDSLTQLQDQTLQQGGGGGGGGGAAPGLQMNTNDPPVRVVGTPREATATMTTKISFVQQQRFSIPSSSSSSSSSNSSSSNEADGEEERAITNDTDQNKRRSEWELTPIPLLFRILGYTDNTTLMIMCLVCKQIKELIWNGQGMENQLVRIFELRPSKNKNFGNGQSPVRRFVSNMNWHCRDSDSITHRMLQGYQHLKVQDVKEFYDHSRYPYITDEQMERLTLNIRMTGIVSLDMSSLLPLEYTLSNLYHAISFMVPNLQQLDLSHAGMNGGILEHFVARCPHLEKLCWNYNDECSVGAWGIMASGEELQPMNNLKELYFDNNCFEFEWNALIDEDEEYFDFDDMNDDEGGDNDSRIYEIDAMRDSNKYPNISLFCKLYNNPLERISIRNTLCRMLPYDNDRKGIPQIILMKFVRKAPSSMVWFRSDLSFENIRILQSERPGIELVN